MKAAPSLSLKQVERMHRATATIWENIDRWTQSARQEALRHTLIPRAKARPYSCSHSTFDPPTHHRRHVKIQRGLPTAVSNTTTRQVFRATHQSPAELITEGIMVDDRRYPMTMCRGVTDRDLGTTFRKSRICRAPNSRPRRYPFLCVCLPQPRIEFKCRWAFKPFDETICQLATNKLALLPLNLARCRLAPHELKLAAPIARCRRMHLPCSRSVGAI